MTGKTQSKGAGSTSSATRQAKSRKATTQARSKRARKSADTQPAGLSLAVSREEREKMIAEAAYIKAEKRGFTAGSEQDDWLEAEKEIDALLTAGLTAPGSVHSTARN